MNRKIIDLKLEDETFVLVFEDGTGLEFRDTLEICCERRYFNTEDNLQDFIGSNYLSYAVVQADITGEHGDQVTEMDFLNIFTSLGAFTIEAYNVHNGYYGGINVEAKELKRTWPDIRPIWLDDLNTGASEKCRICGKPTVNDDWDSLVYLGRTEVLTMIGHYDCWIEFKPFQEWDSLPRWDIFRTLDLPWAKLKKVVLNETRGLTSSANLRGYVNFYTNTVKVASVKRGDLQYLHPYLVMYGVTLKGRTDGLTDAELKYVPVLTVTQLVRSIKKVA